jgi:hypothetical protein
MNTAVSTTNFSHKPAGARTLIRARKVIYLLISTGAAEVVTPLGCAGWRGREERCSEAFLHSLCEV